MRKKSIIESDSACDFSEGTGCQYDCAEEVNIKNFGMGCKPLDEGFLEENELSSGTFCHCDTGDDCNKLPCTDDAIKPDKKDDDKDDKADGGGTVGKPWLALIAIGFWPSLVKP